MRDNLDLGGRRSAWCQIQSALAGCKRIKSSRVTLIKIDMMPNTIKNQNHFHNSSEEMESNRIVRI